MLLYHAGQSWLPGGFLGVEIFFVISGYLITSLLRAEWSAKGSIDLAGFWWRRARRLLPALFALLLAVVGYAGLFLPDELAGLRGDAVSGTLYVNNWYQIFSHHSYFETMGRPPLLRHLWSLAVEEQFYLVWPLLFCLLMRAPRLALPIVLTGIAASALWMAALYEPEADPSRLYYGTDTRAAGILIGAALAFLRRPTMSVARTSLPAWNVASLIAVGVLTSCLVCITEYQALLYNGGFALTGLVTATLIVTVARVPHSLVGVCFAWAPLRWIGVRSYGLYLWHFPIFMLTRPQLDIPFDGMGLLGMRLGLTVLIAALSYKALELPIRRGALERFWHAWRTAHGADRQLLGACGVATAGALAIGSVTLGALLFAAEAPPPPALFASIPSPVIAPAKVLPASQASTLPMAHVAASVVTSSTTPASDLPDDSITAIGDSVMLGVRDQLLRVLGTNVLVDAELGRQPRQVPALLRRLRAMGQLHPVVILHIGDNGIFSERLFDRIMAELAEAREVLIVNVKVPRQWEPPNNDMLAKAVTRYPNAVLVDWHAASVDRPEIFWKDGLHLRPEGAVVYAGLIEQAVRRGGARSTLASR